MPTHLIQTDIDDTSTTDKLWTAAQIIAQIATAGGVTIDDGATSTTKTWSSNKINNELANRAPLSHNHDSSYYTQGTVDLMLATKLATSHTSILANNDHDSSYLHKANTDAYTPSADYHPATKKYVDDNSGGAGAFTDLSDTPGSLTANKWLKVNSGGTALEFTDEPAGGGSGFTYETENDEGSKGADFTVSFGTDYNQFHKKVTLTASVAMSLGTPTGSPTARRAIIRVVQDNTGGRALDLGNASADIHTAGAIAEVPIDTTADAESLLIFEWFNSNWYLVNVITSTETAV